MIPQGRYDFVALDYSPNPMEVKYWVDINSDAHGRNIKVHNREEWIPLHDDSTIQSDYNKSYNKPKIQGITLEGNLTLDELGIQAKGDYALKSDLPINVSELTNDAGYINSIPEYYITEEELESKKYLQAVPDTFATKEYVDTIAATKASKIALESATNTLAFFTGANIVTSIANIPISKQNVISNVNSNGTFSLANVPTIGNNINVIVNNTSDNTITITLPTTTPYKNFNKSTITLDSNTFCKIECITDGSNIYLNVIDNNSIILE